MKLHIDADSMVYAVGFAVQNKDKTVEPLDHVLSTVKRSIQTLLEAVEHTGYQLYLTGADNFRLQLYPEYKANRVAEKPLMYYVLREYMMEKWNACLIDGMEADDAVALAVTEHPDDCIVSMDKDLLTVPGFHLHPKRLDEKVFYVSEGEARTSFYRQLLTGDTADNVPGVGSVSAEVKAKYSIPDKRRGFGPASAAAVVPDGLGEWDAFLRVRECYDNDEILLRNGRLLHMTRKMKDGKPVLWEFPDA